MVKPQNKKQISEESVEAKPRNRFIEPTSVNDEFRDLGKGIINSAWNDLLGSTPDTFSEQLLGFSADNQLTEGQAVSITQKRSEKQDMPDSQQEKIQVTEQHMEYFRTVNNADRIGETRTETQVKQAIEQIRMEIKKLMQTSKLVERTVKDATADQAPVKPGKYHLNFFEFVLGVIKDATRKLEDTVSYGAVFSSKKQQSKYWTKYQKHGTTFGLSGERTTATQTG